MNNLLSRVALANGRVHLDAAARQLSGDALDALTCFMRGRVVVGQD